MRALRRLFSGVLFLLLAFSGCGETNVAQLETHIVIDKQVMSFVQTFEVFALQMATTGGQPVRCQDIPKTYKINDGNLKWCFSDQRQAQCAAAVRWGRQQNEAELGVNVPYGVPLIFVARGTAAGTSGSHVVARGCVDQLVPFSTDFEWLTLALSSAGVVARRLRIPNMRPPRA
jgi:hypothetical protein